jgi:hypothetical protein
MKADAISGGVVWVVPPSKGRLNTGFVTKKQVKLYLPLHIISFIISLGNADKKRSLVSKRNDRYG